MNVFDCLILVLSYCMYTANGQVQIIQTCHPGRLSLDCESQRLIDVLTVEVGAISRSRKDCTSTQSDCTNKLASNDLHMVYVRRQCNTKMQCTVDTAAAKNMCSGRGNKDIERITYRCNEITATTSASRSTWSAWSSGSSPSTLSTASPSTMWSVVMTNMDAVTSGSPDVPSSMQRSNDSVVSTVVVVVLIVVLLAGVTSIVLYCRRRKRRSTKSPPMNGDTSLNFRQLEVNRATTSDEPIYELETTNASCSDYTVLVVTDNIYSEPTGEGQDTTDVSGGLYSEPSYWDGRPYGEMGSVAGAPPSDDRTIFKNNNEEMTLDVSKDDTQGHIYGNVISDEDIRQEDDSTKDIYSDAKPWNEAAYDTVGMKPLHPESEYMIPRPVRPTTVVPVEVGSTQCKM